MNKNAKWIWTNNKNSANVWMCFVKTIDISDEKINAAAKIAADSKYRLYINGKTAVLEGGLKRDFGVTYYDEADISSFLKQGKNTIAALVCYFGENGFSHISSGAGGFLFDADICGRRVVSDNSWKVKRHPAYINASEDNNFRLAEPNVCFDARRDLGEWYMPDYDVSGWSFAQELCGDGEGGFGQLIKRPIPFFKDYGLKDGEFTVEEGADGVSVKMKLPYNMQFTPYFKITASEGGKITLKTDTYDDCLYDTKSVMAEYYTIDGEQEYETLGWMNGETLYITMPKGTVLHSAKYRETGYNTEFAGSFECDDEFLNKLWQKSLRTLYITMRDNFMNCPDRERAQWWGDVNIEMQMAMYSLDKNALMLYKKGAAEMARHAHRTGKMITVVPSGKDQFELPMQNLAGIWGFSYYHFYTGDTELVKTVYRMCKKYIMEYGFEDSGLVKHKTGSWDWPDWGDNADIEVMENAWYYMSLASGVYMAELLGKRNDTQWYADKMQKLCKAYNDLLWNGDCYYGKTDNEMPDDRANALAVLSGLADREKYKSIVENVLVKTMNASPYMEKYVLDAMCKAGFINEAAKRMKTRYKEMTDDEYSTLWEYWNTDGTKNHAWSGGPMITMSKYIAGIYPSDEAYKKIIIKPHLGELNYIKCTVLSVIGEIRVEARRTDETTSLKIELPDGANADVYMPCGNGYKKYNIDKSTELIENNG